MVNSPRRRAWYVPAAASAVIGRNAYASTTADDLRVRRGTAHRRAADPGHRQQRDRQRQGDGRREGHVAVADGEREAHAAEGRRDHSDPGDDELAPRRRRARPHDHRHPDRDGHRRPGHQHLGQRDGQVAEQARRRGDQHPTDEPQRRRDDQRVEGEPQQVPTAACDRGPHQQAGAEQQDAHRDAESPASTPNGGCRTRAVQGATAGSIPTKPTTTLAATTTAPAARIASAVPRRGRRPPERTTSTAPSTAASAPAATPATGPERSCTAQLCRIRTPRGEPDYRDAVKCPSIVSRLVDEAQVTFIDAVPLMRHWTHA